MDILDDMGLSKLSAKVFLKVNYSFNTSFLDKKFIYKLLKGIVYTINFHSALHFLWYTWTAEAELLKIKRTSLLRVMATLPSRVHSIFNNSIVCYKILHIFNIMCSSSSL